MFRTSFNIIWEKIFVMHFPFLKDSHNLPLQREEKNPLRVTKVFLDATLVVKLGQ